MRAAITECRDYSEKELDEAIRRIIENSEFPDVSGKTVLVKPNILSDAPPEKAITTDYRAVGALLAILVERGAERIIVGDSPGTQTGRLSTRLCRIGETAERFGARVSDFREENRVHEIDGLHLPMASALDDADIVISFAKFKTHQLMSATGAVKNMFGLVPSLNKSPLHLKCPSVEEFSKKHFNRGPKFSALASAQTFAARRDFFIEIASCQTSDAPAAKSLSQRWEISSEVMSSMLASSTDIFSLLTSGSSPLSIR